MTDRRVAIITGGANGIGQATAERLAAQGYRVEAWDVDEAALARCDETIATRRIDLAELKQVEAAVAEVADCYGRIDVLVNNAIWRELEPINELSLASWERTLRVGLTVPAFLTRWVAPHLRDAGGGVVVNISSIMSRRAGGIAPAYVAAKGGLDALTGELSVTYAAWGIRVVGIRPGAVDTSLSRDYGEPAGESVDAMRRWSCDHIPLGRWARPEEVASLVAYLCSDEASYLTGTLIDLDGGWSTSHFPASLRDGLPRSDDRKTE